jgi:hypothetical protein
MTDERFDFWINNNYNVLLRGLHGTGKTARVINAFNRNNLKWKYFSASTMDPWTDLCGVPKEVKSETGAPYLDFVLPKWCSEDDVEAIFFDEYNRSPAKVRNATMELIQFKSINGKKFSNLRMVWAAINPDVDIKNANSPEYDVFKLDPAQKDRFEVQIDVPYKPDLSYFREKFGDEVAKIGFQWWLGLTELEKEHVSPRRLDYALSIYAKNGDMRDVLPKTVNVNKLVTELKSGLLTDVVDKIFKDSNSIEAKAFISDENKFNSTFKYIRSNKKYLDFFFPFFPDEKKANLIANDDAVMKYVFSKEDVYSSLLGNITSKNTSVLAAYKKYIRNKPIDQDKFKKFSFAGALLRLNHVPRQVRSNEKGYMAQLVEDVKELDQGTPYRKNTYRFIVSDLYHTRGYANANTIGAKPYTKEELLYTIEVLNKIIVSTTTFRDYEALPEAYGMFCRLLLKNYGESQKYDTLHPKIIEFMTLNADLYI